VTVRPAPDGTRTPAADDRRRLRRAVVGILAVAAAARVALVLATPDLPMRDDPADYHRLAVSVARGHGFGETVLAAGGGPTAFRPPLYPFLLGMVYRVAGVDVGTARAVQAGLGVVAVGLLGVLVARLAGRRAGLAAMALAAVYPPLLLAGGTLMSEAVSLPLELGALLAALAHRRSPRAWRWPVVAGVLVGLAVLARPNHAVLALPVALLLAGSRPRRLGPAVASLVAAAAVVAPWTARNAAVFGRFVPVSDLDGYVAAGVYNPLSAGLRAHPGAFVPPVAVPELAPLFADPALDEVALGDELRRRAVEYARAHPGYVPKVVAWNTLRLFDLGGLSFTRIAARSLGYGPRLADLEAVSFLAVGALALVGLTDRRARRVPAAVWLTPVLFVATTVPLLGTFRYRLPVEPFVLLAAACGLTRLLARSGARAAPGPGRPPVPSAAVGEGGVGAVPNPRGGGAP
jgi:4-amino-4-deoxy-L-arabinose transferase-like glycosyltransferase